MDVIEQVLHVVGEDRELPAPGPQGDTAGEGKDEALHGMRLPMRQLRSLQRLCRRPS